MIATAGRTYSKGLSDNVMAINTQESITVLVVLEVSRGEMTVGQVTWRHCTITGL